ncbi:MAG: hypothetical protein KIS92_25460 [Planctomycetota bacterium]|nr:hypothetical protein [Planctomycetota bacterium]
MDGEAPDAELDRHLRVLQIVSLGLLSGVFTFCAVVVLVFASASGTPAPAAPAATVSSSGFELPAVGLALCLAAIPASFVVKGVLFRGGAGATGGEVAGQLKRFRAGTIVATAICEGSAFALLVLVMLGGAAHAAWAAGVLIPLAGMILHFPTREKFEAMGPTLRSPN